MYPLITEVLAEELFKQVCEIRELPRQRRAAPSSPICWAADTMTSEHGLYSEAFPASTDMPTVLEFQAEAPQATASENLTQGPYCFVLYCIVLYCTVLYCIALYCIYPFL